MDIEKLNMNNKHSYFRITVIVIGLMSLLAVLPAMTFAVDTTRVVLHSQTAGQDIPADYNGLSYETSTLQPDANGRHYFSADNYGLIRMFRTLGVKSLRLGGNSVDVKGGYEPTTADVDALFAFAREAGVKVIYSVRLQDGSADKAARMAAYINSRYAALTNYLAIGNEPGYYKDYERQLRPRWDSIASAIGTAAPQIRICAPDDNPNPVLCQKLIRDYWQQPLSLITFHSYPAGCAYQNPGAAETHAELVPYDARQRSGYLLSDELTKEYASIYQQMEPVFQKYPFRLSETNNYWYGGLDGASNAYATALWAVDYMYWWASRGCMGVNFHTGDKVGGTSIPAHYSAFVSQADTFDVRPLAYAIKLFDVGSHGRLFPVELSNAPHLTAYGVHDEKGFVYVTIINKDFGNGVIVQGNLQSPTNGTTARPVSVTFDNTSTQLLSAATLTMLCADGDIHAKKGITIGGKLITAAGEWRDARWQPADVTSGSIQLNIPEASVVVLKICTRPYHLVSEADEPMQQGKMKPTWQSLEKYKVPEWFRDAKFGIWAHWGPQSVPEYGDWYAQWMYQQDSRENKYHLAHYDHPSRVGFKDLINKWKAEHWNPERLMQLYRRAGAQYFVAMANHHDNFDLWNSHYQPWNATAQGPRKNIVESWARAARDCSLRFGVSVHASRAWNWYDVTEQSDTTGPLAGVAYDGRLTKADGKATWWEGLDPRQLYARDHALPGTPFTDSKGLSASIPDSAWCEEYYNRTLDLLGQVRPDLVYFDDSPLPLYPESDAGLRIAAHYYNSNMLWHNGRQEGVITAKGLTDQQQQCMVWDVERGALPYLHDEPWQTCTCLGSWHYDRTRFIKNTYKSALRVISMLADIVSKNGNLLLSVPIRADGTLDEREEAILDSIGDWMAVNRECIFSTRPWKKYGEGPDADNAQPMQNALGFNESRKDYTPADMRFTVRGDTLYAILLRRASDRRVLIRSLAGQQKLISQVDVLGQGATAYTCDEQGLALTLPAATPDFVPVIRVVLQRDFSSFYKYANRNERHVPDYVLPDVLTCGDGSSVTNVGEWEQKRKPELLRLFTREMYGSVAEGTKAHYGWHVDSIDRHALNGLATRKIVSIRLAPQDSGRQMHLQLWLPNKSSGGKKKSPVFLGLSFLSNESIAHAPEWNLRELLAHGYGLATFHYTEVTPDMPGTGWSKMATWAWAASKAMDYLITDHQVDNHRVAIMGHSRLGKAALWAGATDHRFAAVVAVNSGCCGAALSHRLYGETVSSINHAVPYWFCENFQHYSYRELQMPFDQHEVISLIAPRPLYLSTAEDDWWADPRGEFLGAKAANPVYALYGLQGLTSNDMPALSQPCHGGTIGYHYRPGPHAVTPYDWEQILRFIDRQF